MKLGCHPELTCHPEPAEGPHWNSTKAIEMRSIRRKKRSSQMTVINLE